MNKSVGGGGGGGGQSALSSPTDWILRRYVAIQVLHNVDGGGGVRFSGKKRYEGVSRVRQIVCPVIPGTPKSVVGPLDILPGCSVGTLDLALAASVDVTAVVALSQIRDCVMFE